MNDAVLKVGKMMGNSPEDIEKYGSLSESQIDLSSRSGESTAEAVLRVAKMFGNTAEDIEKYGITG